MYLRTHPSSIFFPPCLETQFIQKYMRKVGSNTLIEILLHISNKEWVLGSSIHLIKNIFGLSLKSQTTKIKILTYASLNPSMSVVRLLSSFSSSSSSSSPSFSSSFSSSFSFLNQIHEYPVLSSTTSPLVDDQSSRHRLILPLSFVGSSPSSIGTIFASPLFFSHLITSSHLVFLLC